MMYWWTRLEWTGKHPVWLVANLLVGLGASRVQKDTRLTQALSSCGLGAVIACVFGFELLLMLQVPCPDIFMCPLCITGWLGRCFLTSFAVRPGNVDRKPLSMAVQNVWGTGIQQDVWWYFTRSLQDCMV